MRAWEPYASGIQLADENLINRPYRFVSDENLQRLDDLRVIWDPDGVFVFWLGRPDRRHSERSLKERPCEKGMTTD
ncbi:hypothetical protein [Streptomyces bauhiniae]|uniref:hypothetical protein n=1 Tax=Streptomyces bauhiniae TaxID=2340725 RepID=UPI00365AC976